MSELPEFLKKEIDTEHELNHRSNVVVQFKSLPEFYEKEKSGKKPNTLRKIDFRDDRFKLLRRGCKRIVIMKSDLSESFERYITDYTEWEGWAIISWHGEQK